MNTGKEYPATHSMMTSWFAVDTEGNVAVVEFGEDGPVPDFLNRIENRPSEVIFQTIAKNDGSELPCLNLTDEQIEVMLSHSDTAKQLSLSYWAWINSSSSTIDLDGKPVYSALLQYLKAHENLSFPIKLTDSSTDSELKMLVKPLLDKRRSLRIIRHCFFTGIIEVDESFEQETTSFLLAFLRRDYIVCRLALGRNLYYVDCDLADEPDFTKVNKHIQKYHRLDLDGFDDISGMSSTPFYYYTQEGLCFPAIKECAPIHPYTTKQMSQAVVDKAIKLPIRFSDSKHFQFVKYYGFETWGYNTSFHTTDDRSFFPMKDENGRMLFYGTKHESPISPDSVKAMLERGEIDWERITRSYYKIVKSDEQILFKSYSGDLVTADIVWQEMHKILEKIANAPLRN